jgi:4-amino-4-deoxy-L-arabinose transferase-like glycosyltransferase
MITLQPYYIVLVFAWILTLLFCRNEIRQAKRNLREDDRKYIYWTQIALFVGVFIRSAFLNIPSGVNPDEALNGYNAWCLANYGVDQHLASFPVYLRAWGSGMSALYAYLAIPFIKVFGLSEPVFRLPMALVSCASLFILYKALKNSKESSYFVFLAVFVLVVSPWHIMKSRWGLDANLAPDLILIGTCILIMGFNGLSSSKRTLYYIAGFFCIALSAYGYAVFWLMLPVYCLLLLIYLYIKKKITIRQVLFSLTVVFILALPLILFAIQLVTKGEQYEIGPITITTLKESRYNAVAGSL